MYSEHFIVLSEADFGLFSVVTAVLRIVLELLHRKLSTPELKRIYPLFRLPCFKLLEIAKED